jgi:hypothetical protein
VTELEQAADRLRAFVRAHRVGGCRLLSSAECRCPQCDIDRIAEEARAAPRLRRIIRDLCIGHEDGCACVACKEVFRHE